MDTCKIYSNRSSSRIIIILHEIRFMFPKWRPNHSISETRSAASVSSRVQSPGNINSYIQILNRNRLFSIRSNKSANVREHKRARAWIRISLMFIAQSKAFRFDGRHTIEFSTNWTIKIDILQQFFGGSGLGLGVRQTISLNGIACIAIDMVSNWWTSENNGSDTIVDNATRAFSIQFSAYRNSVCDNTPFTCFIRWLFVAHSNSTRRTIRLFYAKFSGKRNGEHLRSAFRSCTPNSRWMFDSGWNFDK